jgi:NAD(P)-dependent dehydrogenase (short-subunit alcohol dehydrogenase family)
MKLTGKYAVVTGGASGIGLALSRTLQRHGAQVLAIGRDAAKLDAARELGIGVLSADVANGAQRQRIIDTLLDSPTPIDIFINNAGTMQRFTLLDTDAMTRT